MRILQQAIFFTIILCAGIFYSTLPVHAQVNGTLLYHSRIRSTPSTEGNTILRVVPTGSTVTIFEEQNGWYKVTYGTTQGWMASWLVKKGAGEIPQVQVKVEAEKKMQQVEPVKKQKLLGRYIYTSRLRNNNNTVGTIIATVPAGAEVEILEEKNGWYRVLRPNGQVGWSAAWLLAMIKIAGEEAEGLLSAPTSSSITRSANQAGVILPGVDMIELNRYWLNKVNTLRNEKGLRQLVLDQRFVDTASEYAAYMGETGVTNHERPDTKTMHEWINTKGVVFTDRYKGDGWRSNYFTENIAWGVFDGTMAGAKRVLDETIALYLSEEANQGPHYRTIYHADWNSMGVGFYIKQDADQRYTLYQVFHYGSLQR